MEFQARFHATLVERDEHLLSVADYIPRNPVRPGLCSDPADWRCSNYRATTGSSHRACSQATGCFGDTREQARARYRDPVASRRIRRRDQAAV